MYIDGTQVTFDAMEETLRKTTSARSPWAGTELRIGHDLLEEPQQHDHDRNGPGLEREAAATGVAGGPALRCIGCSGRCRAVPLTS